MRHDYIPGPDGVFDSFVDNFVPALKQWWDSHGLDPAELEPLVSAHTAWFKAYPAHVQAQANAKALAQSKDDAREALVALIRPKVRYVQSSLKTTDAERATLGITVRKRAVGVLPAPATRPLFQIDTSNRLEHRLRIRDEATPQRLRKAAGSIGCEVWVRLAGAGETPMVGPGDLRYLTLATRSVFSAQFPMSDAGKTAVYMLRWVTRTGETGPWSDVMSATVAA